MKCCSVKKPHKLEYPDFELNLGAGRHWLSLGYSEVASQTFNEDTIVTNWNFGWQGKNRATAFQAVLGGKA